LDDISLQYAAATDTGLRRSHNEDCYAATPAIGLWLVADGVGGHSCGEVASDILRNTILE
jgi:serine/threonine protein phosphatase PrpC